MSCLVIHRRMGHRSDWGGCRNRPPCAACSVCVDAGVDVPYPHTHQLIYSVSRPDQLLSLCLDQFLQFCSDAIACFQA